MDILSRWSAHITDIRSLRAAWEQRRDSGTPQTRRSREIESACLFALCIEHHTPQRYLIGFPVTGIATEGVTIERLFDGSFGEIDDWDFLLIDDPKSRGESLVRNQCVQVVRYTRQPSSDERHLVQFLEEKKLRVPHDEELQLLIHIDQNGFVNHKSLHDYLIARTPACPYKRVFILGQLLGEPLRWLCTQVYPDHVAFPVLSESDARALLVDREQYNRPGLSKRANDGVERRP